MYRAEVITQYKRQHNGALPLPLAVFICLAFFTFISVKHIYFFLSPSLLCLCAAKESGTKHLNLSRGEGRDRVLLIFC